ncbi:MAG: hypothetical protein ACPLPV_00135 [Methanomassiliicoccales archaeon]
MDDELIIGQMDILPTSYYQVVERVDELLGETFERSLENFKRFYTSVRMVGTMLAHFLYRLYLQYIDTYQKTIQDFAHMIYSETGISPETTLKYLNVWRYIFENPSFTEEEKEALLNQPIRKLILSYPALRDGEIEPKDVIEAPTLYDLRQKIREKVGDRTSSGSASYYTLQLSTGLLTFHRGDQQAAIGVLNVFDHTDTLREEGIERLIRTLGVLIQ